MSYKGSRIIRNFPPKKLICPICGKEFQFTRIISGRPPMYCSKECRYKSNDIRSHMIHERRNPHSESYRPYDILRMYDMKHEPCIRCGFLAAVILHDIIPASDGGNRRDSSNRIPLCPNCHVTLHKNIWKIWDIEEKLCQNRDYKHQYWLVQILKSENYGYIYGGPDKK